jgi:hydroxyacylglutathione hydrolase
VTFTRPRREDEQNAGAFVGGDRAPFVRVEREERPFSAVDRLAARFDADGTVDHRDERPLLHLVVAERLSGLQDDQDGTCRFVRPQDDRRSSSAWRFDFAQVPTLHRAADLKGRRDAAVRLKRLVSLAVNRYELGPIGTNCYAVRTDDSAVEAVVVDPGAEAARVLAELASMGSRCTAILVTHGHWDHLGGVADLAEATGAPVHMAEEERVLLEDLNSFTPPGLDLRPYTPDVLLQGDEALELAGIPFQTLRVPGHSPAHLAYYTDGALFSGDLVFAGSVGRTDLPGADWDTLVESIRMLADRFPPETVVYSGHGPETTLGVELARNPFLAELRA